MAKALGSSGFLTVAFQGGFFVAGALSGEEDQLRACVPLDGFTGNLSLEVTQPFPKTQRGAASKRSAPLSTTF